MNLYSSDDDDDINEANHDWLATSVTKMLQLVVAGLGLGNPGQP